MNTEHITSSYYHRYNNHLYAYIYHSLVQTYMVLSLIFHSYYPRFTNDINYCKIFFFINNIVSISFAIRAL